MDTATDKAKYTHFLGHRLLKKVSFTVNNNKIDEYGTEEYNAYYQFEVPTDKKIGYLRKDFSLLIQWWMNIENLNFFRSSLILINE